MINYKLCINEIEIDLNKLGVSQSKALQAIDLFTMLFDSKEELVAYINNKENMQLSTGIKLYIKYNLKGEKRIPIILFSDSKNYFNPKDLEHSYNLIYTYVLSKSNDINFLKEFHDFCYYNGNKSIHLYDLRNYIDGFDCCTNEFTNIIKGIMYVYCYSNNNLSYSRVRQLSQFIKRGISKTCTKKEDNKSNSIYKETEVQKQLVMNDGKLDTIEFSQLTFL